MNCWCGKMLSYEGGDCYACPIHGWDYMKPKVLRVGKVSMGITGITGKNNIGCNIHKMRWCVYVEIVDDERIKKIEGITLRVKRDKKFVDVSASRCAIGTKPQIKKWLKHYGSDFDEIRERDVD